MAPPIPFADADIIQNKLNVLIANQQRLLSSWLPPRTADELNNAKTQEEIEREDEAIFTPLPTTLGIGAPIPRYLADDDPQRRHKLSSEDQLRRRMLGKRPITGIQRETLSEGHVLSKPTTKGPQDYTDAARSAKVQADVEDDEEDEGRSSLGRTKSRRNGPQMAAESDSAALAGDDQADLNPMDRKPSNKRSGTFLDEILAERERKRKKKKRTIDREEG